VVRLAALAERRRALVAQCAWQRALLARQLAPAARVLGLADRLVAAVRAHRLLFVAGAALLALARRRPVLPALARLAPLYALLRR
jgi:hypothetical protein